MLKSIVIQIYQLYTASLVAQLVKKLPAMQETCVRSLGWEDPPEKGKAAHSSYLMSFIGVLLLPQLCP